MQGTEWATWVFAACLAAGPSLSPAQARSAWRDTRLPGGGEVMAMHSLPGTLLAGTWNGKVFRSTDGGRNWLPTVSGGQRPFVDFLTVGQITFAASGKAPESGLADCFGYCPTWVDKGGLYRSPDGGKTWSSSGPLEVMAFAVRERALYAATLRGAYKSTDTGRSWSRLIETFSPIGWIPYTHGLHRFSVLGNRVFAWNRWHNRIYPGRLSGDSLAWDRATIDRVQAMTESDGWLVACRYVPGDTSTTFQVERSRDGMTWQVLAKRRFQDLRAQGGTLYGCDGTGLFSSPDGGSTWTPFGPPVSGCSAGAHFLPLHDGGMVRYGWGTSGIALLAPGGDAWQPSNDGLYDHPAQAVSILRGTLLAYSRNSRGQVAAPGEGWKIFDHSSPLHPSPPFAPFGGKLLFAGAGLQVSATGAPGTWDTLSTGSFPGLAASSAWAAAFKSHLSITVCEADAACREVKPANLPPAFFPMPISTRERNGYRGMAISGDSLYLLLDSLYLSVDRAATWTPVAPRAPADPRAFSFHHGRLLLGGAADPLRPETTSGLLWAWDASTRTWSGAGVDGFAAPGAVNAIASRPGETYVGTDSGLYARIPGGAGWIDITGGLPCRGIAALAVEGDLLAAGTACGPVMVRELEPVSLRRAPRPVRGPERYPAGYFRDGGGRWRRFDGRLGVPGPR